MRDMKNITVSVVKATDLLNYTVSPNGRTELTGVEGIYLQLMLNFLGLRASLIDYGENEEYSTPMEIVDRGMADMAFNQIALKEDRFKKAAMSVPYNIYYFTFVVKKTVPLSTRFAFLYSFTLNTWMGYLAVFIFLPVIALFILDNMSSYVDVFFQMIGCFLRQNLQLPMESLRNRMFILSFLFFTMVVSFSYSAVFLSFMVNPLKNPPVRDFEELSEAVVSKRHACYVLDANYARFALEQSHYDYLRVLYKAIKKEHFFFKGEIDFEKVLSDGDAIVKGDTYLDLKFGTDSDVFLSEDKIAPGMLSLYFPKNFRLKHEINTFISRAWSAGLYQKILRDVKTKKFIASKKHFAPNTPKPLGLHDISGVLCILLLCYASSLVILLLEIVVGIFKMH